MPRKLSELKKVVPQPANQIFDDVPVIAEGLKLQILSADPVPATGYAYLWVSDGTGSGDAGDVMMAINPAGTIETATVVDFSGL